ncbi:MAG: NAD(+)/NADH kinase [Deltaproteobacteria bacterium]|nr:NAD(+)/NADH kinase [Deltaproteobacteria bacterium]
MKMKKVGILYHPMIDTARTLAEELKGFIGAGGVSAWLCSAWEGEEARSKIDGTDLIITVGGDGTILRAAQAIVPAPIPITGVNLGRLGFMTELSAEEARDKLPALLDGKGWLDERAMLEAELTAENKPPQTFYALNDVVVARGEVARVIFVEAHINGEPVTTYKADGVIVATATGSTAYSLAAGGPILHPRSADFLLLPISPHLSPAYPLVLPASSVVRLKVDTTHQAVLSVDGHIILPLASGDVITIRHSASISRFLRIHSGDFYGSLEQKLKGKIN